MIPCLQILKSRAVASLAYEMKKLELLVSDQAQGDLLDIWLYVASDSPLAADRFLDLLHEKCMTLCSSPEIGRSRDELFQGIRSLPVKRYAIFYRITNKSVEVVRILSSYRDADALF